MIPRWMPVAVVLANLVALYVSITERWWAGIPVNLFGAVIGVITWRRLRRLPWWKKNLPVDRYRAD